MSAEFEVSPEFTEAVSTPRSTRGFTLIETFVLLGVIVLVIALMLPLYRGGARPAAQRAQCVNNLRQIALALHNYGATHKALPPAYTVDADGRPLHSWRTLILPYLDQEALYQSIDLTKPWNDPTNAKALATSFSAYHCPSSSGEPSTTTYLGIVAPGGCFDPTQPRRLEDVTDGASFTLMVIEVGEENAVPWMAPLDADEGLVIAPGEAANHHHAGGDNACFVDGHVHFLKASTPAKVRRALISISGGEVLSPVDY